MPVGAFGGGARADGHLAPLGRRLPGRHAVGQPGGDGRRPRHAARARARRRLAAPRGAGRELEQRLAPVLAAAPLPARLVRVGSIFWLSLQEGEAPRAAERDRRGRPRRATPPSSTRCSSAASRWRRRPTRSAFSPRRTPAPHLERLSGALAEVMSALRRGSREPDEARPRSPHAGAADRLPARARLLDGAGRLVGLRPEPPGERAAALGGEALRRRNPAGARAAGRGQDLGGGRAARARTSSSRSMGRCGVAPARADGDRRRAAAAAAPLRLGGQLLPGRAARLHGGDLADAARGGRAAAPAGELPRRGDPRVQEPARQPAALRSRRSRCAGPTRRGSPSWSTRMRARHRPAREHGGGDPRHRQPRGRARCASPSERWRCSTWRVRKSPPSSPSVPRRPRSSSTVDIDAGLEIAAADPSAARTVLRNLLENALRATAAAGGGRVSVHGAARRSATCVLEVATPASASSGRSGAPVREVLPRRATSCAAPARGTGLGLYIVGAASMRARARLGRAPRAPVPAAARPSRWPGRASAEEVTA